MTTNDTKSIRVSEFGLFWDRSYYNLSTFFVWLWNLSKYYNIWHCELMDRQAKVISFTSTVFILNMFKLN